MKDREALREMWKNAGILFAITLFAGLILGFVHEVTEEPIRLQEEKAIQEACQEVFADAAVFQELEVAISDSLSSELAVNGVSIGVIYGAYDEAEALLGYVVQSVTSEGYGGSITLYLGVALDGTLHGVSILDTSETAGLGMRAEEVLVPQFAEKNVSEFTYTKTGSTSESEIDAISGATITTKAVVNAVNGGLAAVRELLEGGEGE